MKSNKKHILFILLITCVFTACSTDTKGEPSTENLETQTIEEKQESAESMATDIKPETLRFVDAWGEWHETEILADVEKHPYNWEYLTNDDTGISYVGDKNYTYRLGIDVSKWQGDIDWKKVKADGYNFVIIRLGYRGYSAAGGLKIDEKFYQNIEGAQDSGLEVGVYFFSQAVNEDEAKEEAEFVINALDGYTLQLPVIYDPELIRDQEARTNDVTGEQFTKNTIVFCNTMEEAGYSPMIYSNMVWEATQFDMTELQDYPFWYADYEAIPQTPYNFVMWQYSETGSVDGINGNVDLNILFEPIEH